METLLNDRGINLEKKIADLIETFKKRDEEWKKNMAGERAEWERK